MMYTSKIKRDPSNISLQSGEDQGEFNSSIPLNDFKSHSVTKQDGESYCRMNCSHEVLPAITASIADLDSQSYIKDEESSTTQGDALATPFYALDSGFTNTNALLSCHVKTEPAESEDKEDCESKSTLDCSFDIHVKQETVERDAVDNYFIQGEVDQVKISGNEDGGEETKDCKNTFPDFAILQSTMNDKLPQTIRDSNNSEQGNLSNTIGDTNKQQSTCSVCGKVFKGSQACLWHMWQTHTGEESYTCKLCKKTFICQNDLKCHQISHPNACDLCEKTFTRKSSLQNHKIVCHSNERPYACNLCDKTFAWKSNLEKHKACHSNERPYACDVCKKTFKFKHNVQDHMAVCHSNERPYSCDLCEKAFTRKDSLEKHKGCHSNERPFGCDLCEKTFTQKSHLQRHKAYHSNERPYICESCGKTFTQKSHLQRHKACHSNERPYACDLCKKTFKLKQTLQTHIAVCHSN